MKKILFILYYDVIEYFLTLNNEFVKYNYVIDFYPLFRYAYDSNDKIPNYKEHLKKFITENKYDIIFWFFLDVPVDVFHHIKSNNIYFVMFNFDDPLNMSELLLEKSKIFNSIYTFCNENIPKYKIYGNNPNVNFIVPFADNNFYHKKIPKKYDISIFIPIWIVSEQHNINIKDFIGNIISYSKKKNRVFKIFGNLILKNMFPDNYVNYPSYYELNDIFNSTKINICLHMHNNYDKYITFTEIQIISSKNLLFMDKIKNINQIISDYECVYIDRIKYINQIEFILQNYNTSPIQSIIQKGYEKSKIYSANNFVKQIHINIMKYFFCPDIYSKLYDLEMSPNLFHQWTSGDMMQICYDFEVPSDFDYRSYAIDNNISADSYSDIKIKKIFAHWIQNGKNDIYMKKSANFFDIPNIDPDQWIELNHIFNDIRRDKKNITELQIFCENYSKLDINYFLDTYLRFIKL